MTPLIPLLGVTQRKWCSDGFTCLVCPMLLASPEHSLSEISKLSHTRIEGGLVLSHLRDEESEAPGNRVTCHGQRRMRQGQEWHLGSLAPVY